MKRHCQRKSHKTLLGGKEDQKSGPTYGASPIGNGTDKSRKKKKKKRRKKKKSEVKKELGREGGPTVRENLNGAGLKKRAHKKEE